jgi:methionyl aminopeptidase
MTISGLEDEKQLRKIGFIVAETLRRMKAAARPGITGRELDAIGADYLLSQGARSAPQLAYKFPGATCISVNQCAAHGIPNDIPLAAGDLVNIDVSAELNGYFADNGESFVIEPADETLKQLCKAAQEAVQAALDVVRDGVPLNEIGRAFESVADARGLSLIQNLCSHGVGRSLHEAPTEILPFYSAKEKRVLKKGMVITLEPFLSNGADLVFEKGDGWSLITEKPYFATQFEHTIIVTDSKPLIMTE